MDIEQSALNLIKVYLAQTDSALKISKILSEHSTDKILNGDCIIAGLVYRLMTPMSQEEINESLQNADELMNDDGDTDDDNDDDDIINDDININEEKKIKTNQCNCEICSHVRVCLCNFHNHECVDELAQKFKDSIEFTCKEYNITI
jgi:hypothetical protein